jgi:Mg-chelatase subunit ChlD
LVTEHSHAIGVHEVVAEHARLHDVSVIGNNSDGLLSERTLAEHVMFESGRPLIVVPQSYAVPYQPSTIAAAWDNGATAARALGDAITLLAPKTIALLAIEGEKPMPTDIDHDRLAILTSRRGTDASFKVAKATLDRGERPDPESVRPEEFYNAFDYGDPTPAPGEPVACAIEQAAHPILPQRNLVRVAMRTGAAGRAASQPLNLTVLLDHSGSMEREDRHEGLNQAIVQLASLLKAGDTITVAGFSRTPRLMADRLPGERAKELIDIVRNTPSEGGTNLEEALKLGGDLALRQKNPAAQNRIVLLTDGAANLGNAKPEDLAERIRALRQQDISFDAAGLGAGGVNDRMLETLTRDGNGRYYLIDQPSDADANFAKQLAGAFRPAAENVKVQVHFNPARVGRYKLIGFEKHRLKTEDFRNDKVDAAELAAEEAGVALYQVETLPQGTGEIGEASVRFKDTSTGQMVEQTWTIPYDEKAAAFDQATPSMQLASLAALAAEKLRGGPLAEATDFQSLTPQVAKVRAHYATSKKVGDLIEMIGKLK